MKQSITLLAFLMLCFGISYGQSCSGAPALNCGTTYTSNNISSSSGSSYSNNYGASTYSSCYNGNSSFGARDRIYKVTVPSGNDLKVDLWNLSADLDLFVFASCSGSTPINCVGSSLNSNNSNEQVNVSNASGTYYIVVDGYNSSQLSNFLFRATCTPTTGGGTGGVCAGSGNPNIYSYVSEALTCEDKVEGDNRQTGNNYTSYDCFNGTFVGNDVFYELSFPQTTDATITLSGLSADLDMFIIRCVNGVTDCLYSSTGPNNGNEVIDIPGANGDYFIIIDAQYSSSLSSFVLDISCDDDDDYACADAERLYCGNTYNRSTIGEASYFEYNDLGACTNGVSQSSNPFTGGDDLYRIDVPTGSTLTVSMTGLSADLDMFLFDECLTYSNNPAVLNSCLARSINGNNQTEQMTLSNASGTYYLLVDGPRPEYQSNYRLVIDCANCEDEEDADCDALSYNYTGTNGSLLYQFSVAGAPNGGVWTVQNTAGGNVSTQIGNSTTTASFSNAGTYRVCYSYTKSDGCTYECCKVFHISNPYDCDDITYGYNSNSNSYTLTIPGISNAQVVKWQDDDTGANLGSSTSVSVPVSGSCRIRNFSVFFFDPGYGAYRICCISIYMCDPYDCDNITYAYNSNSNSYSLSIPGISSSNVIRWQDDDTGANLGSSTTVSVPVNGSCRVRNFSVLFYDPGVKAYRVCCISIYMCDPYDCDNITYSYNQSSDSYILSIPGISNANVIRWQDDDTAANLGSNTSVSVPVNGSCRVRNFSVLFYDPGVNAYRVCCISIYVCDPYNCNNITKTLNPNNNIWTLNVPELSSANILFWRDDATGSQIAGSTSTISINNPSAGNCRYISVHYFDPATQSYRVCCLTICKDANGCTGTPSDGVCPAVYEPVCGCDGNEYSNACYALAAGVQSWVDGPCTDPIDPDCDDLTLSYVSPLRYSFSVPNSFPGGTWTVEGGQFVPAIGIGAGSTTTFTFPSAGIYEVCYNYVTGGNGVVEGDLVQCCKTIEIVADPYDCNNITYGYNNSTNQYNLSIPGISDAAVAYWQDDDQNVIIGTTSTVSVSIDNNCRIRNFSVVFYDAAVGAYRICCISIYVCNPYNCDNIVQTYNAATNTVGLSLPGVANSQVLYWQNDDTGQRIEGGTNSTTVNYPASGSCIAISVLFYDPAIDGYRICCLEICNDQPDVCAYITNEQLTCKDDGSYDYSFTLVNNSGYNVDAYFTMQTPIGITFNNCTATVGVDAIGASQNITLNIDNCLVALNPGMNVTYKVTLQEAGKTEGWCCHLDPKTVTIPECEDICEGEPQDIICTTIYAPVCGCNGQTYMNSCTAALAGVQSIVSGPCSGDICSDTEDLVKNGDFEGGNWAFFSTYGSGCYCGDNTYCIRDNARNKCNAWSATTGDGKFLVIEGAAGSATKTVWEQNVAVSPGLDYTFYTDFYPDLTSGSSPLIQFFIDDVPVGNAIEGFSGQWRTYAVNWTAPTSASFAKLQIRKVGSNGGTNDFGVDNVRFEFCLDDIGGAPDGDDEILTKKETSNTVDMMATPNPFTEVTEIKFNLDADMPASIRVFNMDGKQIFLQEGNYHTGVNTVTFEADASLSAGIYYYRLETATQSITKSMVLMK